MYCGGLYIVFNIYSLYMLQYCKMQSSNNLKDSSCFTKSEQNQASKFSHNSNKESGYIHC